VTLSVGLILAGMEDEGVYDQYVSIEQIRELENGMVE
jgi:hypothetical protein